MIRTLLAVLTVIHAAAQMSVAADYATEMMETTFKLYHPDSTATCFFVHGEVPDMRLYIVSAAHVFEGTKGDTAVVVLRQPKDDGSYERRDFTVRTRRDGKPLWAKHEKQDVAVLRVADLPPIPVPALPYSAIADENRLKTTGVHIGSPLLILTYPQRVEANAAGFPLTRHSIFSSPPLLPVKKYPTFMADFTTFAGDSGGPVFMADADGHPLVVGIVLAQNHHDEKVKSEYETLTIRHPLGLGTVLHAQYVRETLEMAAKQETPVAKNPTEPPVEKKESEKTAK